MNTGPCLTVPEIAHTFTPAPGVHKSKDRDEAQIFIFHTFENIWLFLM